MAKTYYLTVGLEVHAELRTATKMFCSSKNDPEEKRPNVNVCPVCMGHPGTLPTVNKEAVRHILKVGLAVGGKISDFTEFDRKNYFYPDIPKGYQISQYQYPLVSGGILDGVSLTRIHLEEDTAKSFHMDAAEDIPHSLIDFNRAGVPLMELVTEPVIKSSSQAVHFAKELQLLLRYLGVGDVNMEKGQMRVEANISVSPEKGRFGKKVEVKNLNSFRSVEEAIDYEYKRQIEILESGEEIVQETRGWDEDRGETFPQRKKESSHDYRYFPDPDIPKLKIEDVPEFSHERLIGELPELPWQRRERYVKDFGLKVDDAEIFVGDRALADVFERVIKDLKVAEPSHTKELFQLASNYIVSDFLGLRKTNPLLRLPSDFSELVLMVSRKEISSRGAKDILIIASKTGENRSIRSIAKESELLQQSDESVLKKIVLEVLAESPNVVAEYKSGKSNALQFLIGQCMKKSKGSANPASLKTILIEHLR